jgi:hypothetical protein
MMKIQEFEDMAASLGWNTVFHRRDIWEGEEHKGYHVYAVNQTDDDDVINLGYWGAWHTKRPAQAKRDLERKIAEHRI